MIDPSMSEHNATHIEATRVEQPKVDKMFVCTNATIVDSLLAVERDYAVCAGKDGSNAAATHYFEFQVECEPCMREAVVSWMRDVCFEYNAEWDMLPLSVQLFDRYLARRQWPRCVLQLLGAAALFVSSKLKETIPLAADKVVMYTDRAFSTNQLRSMELMLTHHLDYDMCGVTPMDFLVPVVQRVLLEFAYVDDAACEELRRRARRYVVYFASDAAYLQHRPVVGGGGGGSQPGRPARTPPLCRPPPTRAPTAPGGRRGATALHETHAGRRDKVLCRGGRGCRGEGPRQQQQPSAVLLGGGGGGGGRGGGHGWRGGGRRLWRHINGGSHINDG